MSWKVLQLVFMRVIFSLITVRFIQTLKATSMTNECNDRFVRDASSLALRSGESTTVIVIMSKKVASCCKHV